MDFIRNFPFFSIVLSLFSGPLSSILGAKWAKRINGAVIVLCGLMSGAVLWYVCRRGSHLSILWDIFQPPGATRSGRAYWRR